MNILILIALLLLFLLALLLSPLRLSLRYEDEISLSVSYLFLKFPIYPKEEKVRLSDYTPQKLRKKKKKARRKRPAALPPQAPAQKEKPLEKRLRALRLYLFVLKRVYANILSAVRIRVERLSLSVATDDAAKTALLYGVASQSVAYLLEMMRSFTKTKVSRDDVNVVADFCGSTYSLEAKIIFRITPLSLLGIGIKSVFYFFKFKQKDADKKQERSKKS